MKILTRSHISFAVAGLATALLCSAISPAWAENLFAPLNEVYEVNQSKSAFGIKKQGTGRLNTNLLSDIFNPRNNKVRQVPLQMLDGSQSTLHLRRQESGNVGGIQIVSGIVDGESHNMATLVNNRGELRGRIWKDGKLFRLYSNKSGRYRLSEINSANLPEGKDTIEAEQLEGFRNSNSQKRQAKAPVASENEPIDLLLFVTKRAIKELGGREKAMPEMELLIAETNNIYQQSGASDGPMFRVVGLYPFPLKEHDDIEADLTLWRSNKALLSFRNSLGADLVAFITAPNDPNYCGMGFIGPDASDPEAYPELGYSISVLDCALTNLTFAHELGHNMGARHDRFADPSDGDNHGFVNLKQKWRTVMAYSMECWVKNKEGCPKVPYFSNPGLKYSNSPLGKRRGQPDSADNAEAIRRNKQLVASYRPRADAEDGERASASTATSSNRRTPETNTIGGIILESAAPRNQRKSSGKERVIKW